MTIAVAVALVSLLVGAAAGTVSVVRGGDDRVQILGSGDSVSLLITSDQSRLLIATGDDRAGFGNAIDVALRGPGSGADILLIAGAGRNLAVPVQALDLRDPGRVFAVHPIRAAELGDPRLVELPTLPANPARITLADHLTVTIEWLDDAGTGDRDAWRAVVAMDSTRIAIVSRGPDVPLFEWADPVTALIVAGDAGGTTAGITGARTVVAAASSLDPEEAVSGPSAIAFGGPTHLVPVRPGDVATLVFENDGIRLSSDGHVTAIEPTPGAE